MGIKGGGMCILLTEMYDQSHKLCLQCKKQLNIEYYLVDVT